MSGEYLRTLYQITIDRQVKACLTDLEKDNSYDGSDYNLHSFTFSCFPLLNTEEDRACHYKMQKLDVIIFHFSPV